jgi:transposase
MKETRTMVTFGIDAHKRTHTVVAVDDVGRQLAAKTTASTTAGHLELLAWAQSQGGQRSWAVEDCRHVSRRLERDLLVAGERIVRVPPKLMAGARRSARTYGKSDPIDALAVARAALREPDLPTARLDGPERELRLLVDHREDLVGERVRAMARLRWHLHELDPGWEPAPRSLDRPKTWATIESRLAGIDTLVARLARDLVERCRQLTIDINQLRAEITARITPVAPALLAICGCGPLTAAKIVAETAGVDRFRSAAAYARHNGTAPLPVWSANQPRHRLSRTGNRQLNAALYRIALTQARCHPGARNLLERRRTHGDSNREAFRVLRRRLSDIVYRAMRADQQHELTHAA